MRTAQLCSLASLTALLLSLTACVNPSQTEVAAWEALAVEALELSAEETAQVPKPQIHEPQIHEPQIHEPWADAQHLPQPGETRGLGTTIGQEIAQSTGDGYGQGYGQGFSQGYTQGATNTAPSFQPARFTREVSRADWDLALQGYLYDYPEAPPVTAVSPASVGQYGASDQRLVLAGVPVAQLAALEARVQRDQRPRPDCLRILRQAILNYCSIDTLAQACFGRTCQYFDIPAGQGVELRAGFDSLVGQRHPRDGDQPIRADRSAYASGSHFIPLAVAWPVSRGQAAPSAPISSAPAAPAPSAPAAPASSAPASGAPASGAPASPAPALISPAPSVSPEEAEAWDSEPLFAPAQ